jgi:hypothetical protein
MALIEPDICDYVRLLDPSRARSAQPPPPQIVQFAAVLARHREGRDPNATQTVLSDRLFRSASRPALASDTSICFAFWTSFAVLRREADSGCPVIAGVSQRCAELARGYDAPVCPSWRTPVPRSALPPSPAALGRRAGRGPTDRLLRSCRGGSWVAGRPGMLRGGRTAHPSRASAVP